MDDTILLVDDVRLFLEMQKEFLEHSAVQVVTAGNGREALDAVEAKRPDLVFMDAEMPGMDGIECCRAIKSDPRWSRIPVIMITAKGDVVSQQRCRTARCDALLTKPLNRALFLATAGRFVTDLDRRARRAAVALPATLRSRNCQATGTLRNLSSGGAFVAAECDADIGRIVELSFALPDGDTQECRAKIVWAQQDGPMLVGGFGISFVLLPEATRSALNRYLKNGTFPTRPAYS